MEDLEGGFGDGRIENQIKVKYVPVGSNWLTTAYVNEDTLEGVNKWSDTPVKLFWSDEEGFYREMYVMVPVIEVQPKEPFIRIQPKRLSRKQRRDNGHR